MLSMRASTATAPNGGLVEREPKRGENGAWLARAGIDQGWSCSAARPSPTFGSLRAVARPPRPDAVVVVSWPGSCWAAARLLTVPLDPGDDSSVRPTNAIRAPALDAFDDPERYPNVALIAFAAGGDALASSRRGPAPARHHRPAGARVAWLAMHGASKTPIRWSAGTVLPSAAFVEAAHAVAEIELTPGLASASSCPEAIWQSARWWGEYYRESARTGSGVAAQSRPRPAAGASRGLRRPPARGRGGLRRPDDDPSTTRRRTGATAMTGRTRAADDAERQPRATSTPSSSARGSAAR